MVKLVLGVAGTIGAGKDTFTNYIKEKYNFQIISMGDLVREEAKQLGMLEDRETLQDLANKRRAEFGIGYWARKAAKKISESKHELFAINGMRTPADVSSPKKVFGDKFKLLLLDATPETRFKRLKARKRLGDPKTLAEFKKQEEREWKLFDFKKTITFADFKIENEVHGHENFYKQIDELIAKLLH